MNKKSQGGITIVALTITVVLLLIIAGVAVKEGFAVLEGANLETLNTNMLFVQAKAKTVLEKHTFDGTESLEGVKLSNVDDQATLNKINELKEKNVITEESAETSYVWDQEKVNTIGLGNVNLKGAFFIVDYGAEEVDVIYSEGFKYVDGVTYYKLSDTINLKVEVSE